jgi:hypothetical protein
VSADASVHAPLLTALLTALPTALPTVLLTALPTALKVRAFDQCTHHRPSMKEAFANRGQVREPLESR